MIHGSNKSENQKEWLLIARLGNYAISIAVLTLPAERAKPNPKELQKGKI